ncbi:hypothetical protein B0T16DRAFT_199168 [Cercophora newfieldiana]|uniref:BZIP transcription factor n=1 Tax=Cercophora newfieldiana TaxID=92897 RepID=A0AA39Y250_9PEZI|nr:hypothetical protein B0T16DRAFT_199168 [Cercophora newfieldiana]
MSSRLPEAEPAKVSKRKGTRSVSTLTPSQLARKRANDREAQRAIRARTKEHIERLEKELEDYKSRQSRDLTIQDLMRRNKELEMEVNNLRAAVGRPYPAPGYDIDGLPAGSAVPSRASSFGNGSGEYNTTPGFGPSYLPTPEPCESWPSVVPVSAVPVPSVVSSPCSSTGHPEDYVPGYIPTSVPASMMGGSVVQPANMSCLQEPKVEFEDIDATTQTDHGIPHSSSAAYLQQQSWPMYPPPTYYS